jgi:histidine triad (HIT) family protein
MAEDCIFCNIAEGKTPSVKVYDDGKHMAFLDINPRNPGHTVVIPKKHYANVMEMPEREAGEFFQAARRVAIAVRAGVNAQGISIGQGNGLAAGQRVPHAYFHVIPRFESESPPGLEEIIPIKRIDQAALKAVGEKVKSGFSLETEIERSVESVFKEPRKSREPEPSGPKAAKAKKMGEDDIDFKF